MLALEGFQQHHQVATGVAAPLSLGNGATALSPLGGPAFLTLGEGYQQFVGGGAVRVFGGGVYPHHHSPGVALCTLGVGGHPAVHGSSAGFANSTRVVPYPPQVSSTAHQMSSASASKFRSSSDHTE